jgi:hypothetical protein
MPYPGEQDSSGKVWVEAPHQNPIQTTSAIWGVWINPNEEVEWQWTYVGQSSYISGYTIRPRINPCKDKPFSS